MTCSMGTTSPGFARILRSVPEAAAFSIVMLIIAWFDGSIDPSGAARPLWFQVCARLLIYLVIFFVVSLIVDAVFERLGKKN